MKLFSSSLAALGALLLAATGCSSAGAGGPQGTGGGAAGGAGGASGSGTPLHGAAIAVGAAHSCAVLENGGVACWGDGARGQLGDGASGTGYHRGQPAKIAGLTGVTLLRAGGDTTCAVIAGGAVVCWGDGAFGQLGDGTAADGHLSAVPVPVSGLMGVVDLGVSGENACAALTDGTVRCWGRNAPEAWLGFDSMDCGPYTVTSGDNGPKAMYVPCESTPKQVPAAKGAVAVASGGEHNCLVTSDGGARCWGADPFGQLGDGVSGPDAYQPDPVEVASLTGVKRLALGSSHTCAIAGAEGAVRCWGDNAYGQLGIGTDSLDSYKITATPVTGLSGIADLHAAARTTCAARADGTVACWGATATVLPVSPQKGGAALSPTDVPGVAGAVEVRTGGSHVCARRDDGMVVCWGTNDRGQLGNGEMGLADFSMAPVLAPPDPPG
jgi:alpha-tubulin suppressor-like RCC1 family protein